MTQSFDAGIRSGMQKTAISPEAAQAAADERLWRLLTRSPMASETFLRRRRERHKRSLRAARRHAPVPPTGPTPVVVRPPARHLAMRPPLPLPPPPPPSPPKKMPVVETVPAVRFKPPGRISDLEMAKIRRRAIREAELREAERLTAEAQRRWSHILRSQAAAEAAKRTRSAWRRAGIAGALTAAGIGGALAATSPWRRSAADGGE